MQANLKQYQDGRVRALEANDTKAVALIDAEIQKLSPNTNPIADAPTTSIAEEMVQKSRQNNALNDPVGLVYRINVDPVLEMSGMALDGTLKAAQFLSDRFGTGEVAQNIQSNIDSRGGPSDYINKFRMQLNEGLAIPDPQTRAEILNETMVEYGEGLTKLGLLSVAARKVPVIGSIGNVIIREIKKRPLLFLASEGAGVIAETEAEFQGVGDLGQTVIGATTSVLSPFAYNRGAKYLSGLTNNQFIKKYSQQNFTNASEVLQSIARDPEGVAARLDGDFNFGVPVASGMDAPLEMITGDSAFTAFERQLTEVANDINLTERDNKFIRDLANIFDEGKNATSPLKIITHERERLEEAINLNTRLRLQQSQQRLKQLNPNATVDELSEAVAEAVDSSYDAARRLENEMWDAVDMSGSAFQYPNTRKIFNDLFDPKAGIDLPSQRDIPKIAKEYLSEKGKLPRIADLYGLYRQLGKEASLARKFGAGQNKDLARIAEQLRAAIWDDLQKIPGSNVQLLRAKNTSRLVKKQFDGNVVRRFLGEDSRGRSIIDPADVLSKSIKSQDKGLVGFQDLIKSVRPVGKQAGLELTENDRIVIDSVEGFLKDDFVKKVFDKNGILQPQAAKDFIEKNSRILSDPLLRPLRAQLESAQDLGDVLRKNFVNAEQQYASRFKGRSQQAVNRFFEANALDRMKPVFESGDPVANVNKLLEFIRITPEQTFKNIGVTRASVNQGLKDTVFEYITNLGKTKTKDTGLSKLSMVFGNKEMNEAFRRVLSPAEMDRVKKYVDIVNTFNIYSTRAAGKPPKAGATILEQMVGTISGGLVSLPVTGAGQLSAAAFGKKTTIEILVSLRQAQTQQLLVDALNDPKLFKALMQNPATKAMGNIPAKRTYLGKYILSNLLETKPSEEDKKTFKKTRGPKTVKPGELNATSTFLELLEPELLNPFSEQSGNLRGAVLLAPAVGLEALSSYFK